ncbi:MAG: AI-2E family transporter [bacterium]
MEDKNVTINISSGTIVRGILFFLLLVGLYLVRDVVLVVLTAVMIAAVLEPGTRWFVRHKIPRPISALIIYLLLLSAVAGVFYFLIPPVLNETQGFLNNFPQYIQVTELWAPLGSAAPVLHIPQTIQVNSLVSQVSASLASISGGFFATASNFLGGVFSFSIILVISFYLLVKEDGVAEFLEIIVPLKQEEYFIGLWKRTQAKIGRWMQGQLLLMLIVGVLIYFGLLVLRVPHALLLGVLAFICEIIPVFGMTIAAIPAFLLGALNGGWTLGLLVAGLYLIVQQFEANVIYPLVVKKIVGIPPLLVIISLIIGAKLAGFLGIILSVPLSVALMEFIEDVNKRKIEARSRH